MPFPRCLQNVITEKNPFHFSKSHKAGGHHQRFLIQLGKRHFVFCKRYMKLSSDDGALRRTSILMTLFHGWTKTANRNNDTVYLPFDANNEVYLFLAELRRLSLIRRHMIRIAAGSEMTPAGGSSLLGRRTLWWAKLITQ